jgi:hypothetical protein
VRYTVSLPGGVAAAAIRRGPQAGRSTRVGIPLTVCLIVTALSGLIHVGGRAVSAGETDVAPSPAVVSLDVFPAVVNLTSPRDRQGLIVTGVLADGTPLDLTAEATFVSADPSVVRFDEQGPSGSSRHIVRPVHDGEGVISIQWGEWTKSVTAHVRDTGAASPIHFRTEVLAALTKSGCNSGACHGSPSGKGGFRLSLRGYDPELDQHTLRTEFSGRRTNVLDPDASLLLKKPLMQVGHAGGRRLHRAEAPHRILRSWIAEGMIVDGAPTLTAAAPDRSTPASPAAGSGSSSPAATADAAQLLRIAVHPRERVFYDLGRRQQLVVLGTFGDGRVTDVTELTDFTSSDAAVATVDRGGLVTRQGRGETTILARYLDRMDTSRLTFLEQVPDFAWTEPEPDNVVDRLVGEKLRQLQIVPSELCTDDEFVRRLSLDVAGRLPTPEERQAFLDDVRDEGSSSPSARSRLIERMLASPDHAAYWGLHWADVLRVNTGRLKTVGVAKFHRWIVEGVLRDQPMDEFARELLTARGSVYENPAASFWRASRDPQDATETTAQLFLGIRIQCAKCHNHPFERWTQDNYFGVGSAFARVGRKPGLLSDDEVIFVSTSGESTHPRTGQAMPVHLLLTGDVAVPAEQDRRAVFADWLTSAANPFFARALVNRMWGQLFGRGIVDPVDDFRDSNPPSNPALLDELARQFSGHGFSRRWLLRTILNSRTYQRSARTNSGNAADDRYFSHSVPRMLSAEQLLDAVSHVTGMPESFPGVPRGTRAAELLEPPGDHDFLRAFGQPQREMACACERSTDTNLAQALQMINGPTVHRKLGAEEGRIAQWLAAGLSDEQIVHALYVTALCREPLPDELEAGRSHVRAAASSGAADARRAALQDVCWALLNTKEFMLQH